MNPEPNPRHPLEEIFARSATDPAFRTRLLAEPRAAVLELFGSVPEPFDLVFVESAPGTTTVVLPPPIDPAAPLGDEALEAVAGGGFGFLWPHLGIPEQQHPWWRNWLPLTRK